VALLVINVIDVKAHARVYEVHVHAASRYDVGKHIHLSPPKQLIMVM